MYDGKNLKLYRTFITNLYDGSLQANDRIETSAGEIIKLGGMGSKRKKQLKELTKSKPELASKIDQLETYKYADVIALLKEFEKE